MDDFDPNKIAVDFLNSNLDRIVESVGKTIKGAGTTVKARLSKTYTKYLARVVERYAKSKSFFVRSEPIPIYDFFIPPNLSTSKGSFLAPGAKALQQISSAAIITGTGGSGKSMFLRHLLLTALTETDKVPVFIELRNIENQGLSIKREILEALNSNGLDANEEYLDLALKRGHFMILLDGFDEVELSIREKLAKQIQSFEVRYPKNSYVLSSRGDSSLESWQNFSVFAMEPFEKEQAIALVKKLPFDERIKKKFIQSLAGGLFEQHQSFLSNPLLLSIMLLTYSDNASIPRKLSIFYSQAYESLFQKHDALKGGYQRDRRSTLDIQDFSRAFSAFCIQSYDKREFTFSQTSALDYFDSARRICGIDFKSNSILEDSIQAVCLMVEDGLEISFAHRSFQEYFAAKFIESLQPESKKQMIERFKPNVERDSVLELLFELDQYSVERYYILPEIDALKERVGFRRKVGVTHSLKYIREMFSSFSVVSHGEVESSQFSATINESSLFGLVQFIRRNYSEVYLKDFDLNNVSQHHQELEESFKMNYGDNAVIKTSKLKTTDLFLQKLLENKGFWDTGALNSIINLGSEIRKRHKDSVASLESIIGNRPTARYKGQ